MFVRRIETNIFQVIFCLNPIRWSRYALQGTRRATRPTEFYFSCQPKNLLSNIVTIPYNIKASAIKVNTATKTIGVSY